MVSFSKDYKVLSEMFHKISSSVWPRKKQKNLGLWLHIMYSSKAIDWSKWSGKSSLEMKRQSLVPQGCNPIDG